MRSAVLAIVSKILEEDETFELVYFICMNRSHITAIANIDTDAQCSAIRSDVAGAAGIDWCKIHSKGC